MTVDACQQQITSTEYLKWLVYLDEQDLHRFDRTEHYLAQIAMEVRRSYTKRKNWRLSDFLLKFTTSRSSTEDDVVYDADQVDQLKQEKAEVSRRGWFACLGLTKKDL